MKHTYRDTYRSILRFAKDFADRNNLVFVNLDAHADDTKWPKQDFIGLANFTMQIGSVDEVYCTFAISTRSDSNLIRMADLVNDFINTLHETGQITVYDAQTGQPVRYLSVTLETQIAPVMNTSAQPVTPIQVHLIGSAKNH